MGGYERSRRTISRVRLKGNFGGVINVHVIEDEELCLIWKVNKMG